MLCRLQNRDGRTGRRKVIIVHARLKKGSERALSGQAAKAKAKGQTEQRARAWEELACCSLSLVHRWLRMRESCGEARSVLDCRSRSERLLAALPSIRRSRGSWICLQ